MAKKMSARRMFEHATSAKGLGMIRSSGYFRAGSWFTTDAISDLRPAERVRDLCLDAADKGDCACECAIDPEILEVPSEGAFTCRGLTQYQIADQLPYSACQCSCTRDEDAKVAAVILTSLAVGGVLAWLFTRDTKKSVPRPVATPLPPVFSSPDVLLPSIPPVPRISRRYSRKLRQNVGKPTRKPRARRWPGMKRAGQQTSPLFSQ